MSNKRLKQRPTRVGGEQVSPQIEDRRLRRVSARNKAEKIDSEYQDLASELEMRIGIFEDLIAIAIEEVGNGGGRTLALLLAALRYVDDFKDINRKMMRSDTATPDE